MVVQLSAKSKLKPMNPPNTTRMETNGIMELKPSIFPRLPSPPLSVSHALKAASLAAEPKNVIMQSKTMVNVTPRAAACTAPPAIGVKVSTLIKANPKMEIPQTIYPRHIITFRFPNLSDRAPTRMVVKVAATELAPTIREISAADA